MNSIEKLRQPTEKDLDEQFRIAYSERPVVDFTKPTKKELEEVFSTDMDDSFESESLTESSIDSQETCMRQAHEVFDKQIEESDFAKIERKRQIKDPKVFERQFYEDYE